MGDCRCVEVVSENRLGIAGGADRVKCDRGPQTGADGTNSFLERGKGADVDVQI